MKTLILRSKETSYESHISTNDDCRPWDSLRNEWRYTINTFRITWKYKNYWILHYFHHPIRQEISYKKTTTPLQPLTREWAWPLCLVRACDEGKLHNNKNGDDDNDDNDDNKKISDSLVIYYNNNWEDNRPLLLANHRLRSDLVHQLLPKSEGTRVNKQTLNTRP